MSMSLRAGICGTVDCAWKRTTTSASTLRRHSAAQKRPQVRRMDRCWRGRRASAMRSSREDRFQRNGAAASTSGPGQFHCWLRMSPPSRNWWGTLRRRRLTSICRCRTRSRTNVLLKHFERDGLRTAPRGRCYVAVVQMRLGNDHTSGTRPGGPTPKSSVADNDLAVGRIVEAISHSAYWDDTAIFILEDDAQNGADRVMHHLAAWRKWSASTLP